MWQQRNQLLRWFPYLYGNGEDKTISDCFNVYEFMSLPNPRLFSRLAELLCVAGMTEHCHGEGAGPPAWWVQNKFISRGKTIWCPAVGPGQTTAQPPRRMQLSLITEERDVRPWNSRNRYANSQRYMSNSNEYCMDGMSHPPGQACAPRQLCTWAHHQ